jgi:cobalt/nickel transport system permease protein
MAIGGPLVAYYLVWKPLAHTPPTVRIFATAFTADLATYLITATQLALAFPDPLSGFGGSWLKFAGIFAVTQLPLAVAEGILTVLLLQAVQNAAGMDVTQLIGQGKPERASRTEALG